MHALQHSADNFSRVGLSLACFSEEAIEATDAEQITTEPPPCMTQTGLGEPAEGAGKPCQFPFKFGMDRTVSTEQVGCAGADTPATGGLRQRADEVRMRCKTEIIVAAE